MRAQSLALAYFAVFGALLLLLGMVAWFGRPSDGDPVARIDFPAHAVKHVAAKLRPAVPAPAANAIPPAAPTQPATPVPPQVVPANVDKPVVVGKNLVADPALIEQTPQGPLPRIAADGRTPMNAYAPPAPAFKGPRIAIVIGDLGISAKGTATTRIPWTARRRHARFRTVRRRRCTLGRRSTPHRPRSAPRSADGTL